MTVSQGSLPNMYNQLQKNNAENTFKFVFKTIIHALASSFHSTRKPRIIQKETGKTLGAIVKLLLGTLASSETEVPDLSPRSSIPLMIQLPSIMHPER